MLMDLDKEYLKDLDVKYMGDIIKILKYAKKVSAWRKVSFTYIVCKYIYSLLYFIHSFD